MERGWRPAPQFGRPVPAIRRVSPVEWFLPSLLALALVSCGLFESVPAYRVSLFGTTWAVHSIRGEPVQDGDFEVSFQDPDKYILSTPCDKAEGTFAYDSDGSAMAFGEASSDSQIPCTPSQSATSDLIERTIPTIDSWRVQSDREISLISGGQVLLHLRQLSPTESPSA